MTTDGEYERMAPVHDRRLRTLIALTTMAIVSSVSACAADAPVVPMATARVIIRFVAGTEDPQGAAFLARLAAQARVTGIDAIRPMSGDAFVMQVACVDPRDPLAVDPCTAALARLGRVEGVVGVEIDRRERIR